ncbi:N2,N2-dimethylguanosine tRNA methyltransferase [Gigaspora margarita]|uniref:tRNA (guanine(26)-N(2))-dimethyltransferase n=1 Tax=Gigaspora margarita TaxID=4874 RepID=A0A8H4EJM2_GIGMA|nr:N2,N2-dimethylguanosine tRNA methyltransferase [Gigaspora margarita]
MPLHPTHPTLYQIIICARSREKNFFKLNLVIKNWQTKFSTSNRIRSLEKIVKMDNEFNVITEGKASILFPKNNKVFYNNVQQFNRDISIAAIKIWSKIFSEEKLNKAQQKKGSDINIQSSSKPSKTYTFTILEALAASGLRSIRYAKEIPNIKYIIANDLDLDAVDLINKNVEYNELSKDFVRANQGDACSVLYQHRSFPDRFDVIDLDPYGTAAPFIDGAVQAVEEGGLLCVTCTDLANLTGSNYPEKCYANYGSIPVKGEFCHEMALRILLHTLSTSAAKYRRRIIPLLCCSIDFYIRIFVRVVTSPVEVKNNPCKTSMLYVCTGCHSYYTQPLAKVTGKNTYVPMVGPIVNNSCEHCENKFHVGGPIWTHSIHDKQFVLRMLEHVKESNNETYQTHSRMLGMLSVIMEELDIPLFHNLSALAGTLHCTSPSLKTFCSAILNKGYKVSASHAMAGSVKTDAPMSVIWDIFRSWIQLHPVTMKNIKENSPARKILAIEPRL